MSAPEVVLVAGPPRAGVTAMVGALGQRMPSTRFVESGGVTATDAVAAVVFVTSAVAPLVESDCAILGSVPDADLVIAVVSKIDDHRGWRDVLAADRELLGPHVVWVGAAAAPRLGEPSVDELVGLLHTELYDPTTRNRNLLRGNEARLAVLGGERDELARRRRLAASERGRRLRSEVQHTRLTLTQAARRRCADLRTELVGEAASMRRRDVRGFADHVRHRCGDVLAEIDGDIVAYADQAAPPSPVGFADPPLRSRRLESRLTAVLGAGFGFGVALVVTRFAAGLAPGLAAAGLAAGVGLGAATAVWVIRARALLHVRAVLHAWVADVCAAVRAAAEEKVAAGMLDAEAVLASDEAAAASERDAEFARRIASIDVEIRKLARLQKDPSLLPTGRPPGDGHLNRSCE